MAFFLFFASTKVYCMSISGSSLLLSDSLGAQVKLRMIANTEVP